MISIIFRNTQTTLPAGVYCDVYSGDLVNNQCTGTQITVGSDGKLFFFRNLKNEIFRQSQYKRPTK